MFKTLPSSDVVASVAASVPASAAGAASVAGVDAVLSVVGKRISLYKDRLWTVEYRECGYRGTDTVRRYAIRAGGNPCRDIGKSVGRKIHQAGEGLRRQDSVACDAADCHTIPVLLYRTRPHKRSQGVHHRGSKCIRCHHSVGIHIPSGESHCKEDAWMSGWICGSCSHKYERNELSDELVR